MFGLVRYRAEVVYIRDCITVSVMDSVFVPLRFPLSISNCFDYQRLLLHSCCRWFLFWVCLCICVCVDVQMQDGGVGKTSDLYCRMAVPMTRFLFYLALWTYVDNKPLCDRFSCFICSCSLFNFWYGCIQAILLWLSHALHRGNRPKPPPRLLKQRPISHSSLFLCFSFFSGAFSYFSSLFAPGTNFYI